MTKEIMTIHKALAELKTLDSRIMNGIDMQFCVYNRHSNNKINGVTIDDFKSDALNKFKSVNDLIKRRDALKMAVVLSNATTTVTINGIEYTVAVAIEMKNHGMQLKAHLLDAISDQYDYTVSYCNQENDKLSEKSTTYIQNMFGLKEVKTSSDEIEKAKKLFEEQNTYEVVDPINCKKVIEELTSEIDSFMTEVDSALSVSNALTEIEIEY